MEAPTSRQDFYSLLYSRFSALEGSEHEKLWNAVMVECDRATDLRGFVRGGQAAVLERFLTFLQVGREARSAPGVLEYPPLTERQEEALVELIATWHKETDLQKRLAAENQFLDRFVALLRIEASLARSLEK